MDYLPMMGMGYVSVHNACTGRVMCEWWCVRRSEWSGGCVKSSEW